MGDRSNCSILVVDDDTPTRYALARSLRAAGYKTMEAASGAEALEFAEYVAGVILDIHLPDVIGWEVCRLLRQKPSTSRIAILHVTARYTSEEDRQQSKACGANGFFPAPVDPDNVIRELDTLLGVSGARPS